MFLLHEAQQFAYKLRNTLPRNAGERDCIHYPHFIVCPRCVLIPFFQYAAFYFSCPTLM